MDAPHNRIWPVILSGGAGTRLWPLSRTASPKQLLPLAGPETMIAMTAARVADTARFHPPLVVTGAGHAAQTLEQLGPATRLIVEPAARNTAPAIALAMLAVAADDPDGLLLVMPSDHRLALPGTFLEAVVAATEAAQAGWLVTFGIRASAPETGYGYIRAGVPLDAGLGAGLGAGLRAAAGFFEKPDRARAQAFVADGGYSWNSGIFLFSVAAMRAALAAHAPEVLAAAEAATARAHRAGTTSLPDGAAFAAAPSISIDHAVFERAAKVAVLPVDPGWSDIGSWDALHGLGVADAQGNVAQGVTVAIDTQGCLLRAEGVVLATIGVNNLNIIATPDAVLVTARGRGEDVRTVAARLAGNPVLARPLIERHAWGEMHIVHDGAGTRVRKAVLAAGATLIVDDPATQITLVGGDAACAGLALATAAAVNGGGPVIAATGGATLILLD